MSSFWTVEPDQKQITLIFRNKSFTVDLKKHLTTGEVRQIMGAGVRSIRTADSADGEENKEMDIRLDMGHAAFVKVRIYIANWSLKDDKSAKLAIELDTLKAMHPALFKLIEVAVDEHQKEMQKELEELEKKFLTSESDTQKISA